MFGGPKAYIGLDIGSYSVKAVALQPNKERLALAGYAMERIGDQDAASVVRRVMEELGVKSRHLASAVSGRSVIVRQVETPRLDHQELKAHIAYEADKYIPFGADEVVIDCQTLPEKDVDAKHMNVLLVAVRRGFVEDHISMLQQSGVQNNVIDVDVFSLCNAYWTLGPNSATEEAQIPTALIDIGATKSWVAIVKGNQLLFQREIYLAGNEVTDAIVRTFNETAEDVEELKLHSEGQLEALIDAAMPALEDLANEIRLSFDYVEGQFDEEVERVILTGGTCLLPSLSDMLGNILGRPVSIFDPLSGLDLVSNKYDLHELDSNAPALTVALGLACHDLGGSYLGLGGGQIAVWHGRAPASSIDNSNAITLDEENIPMVAESDMGMVPPSAPEPLPVPGGIDMAPPPLEMPANSAPDIGAIMPPPAASDPGLQVSIPRATTAPNIDIMPPAAESGPQIADPDKTIDLDMMNEWGETDTGMMSEPPTGLSLQISSDEYSTEGHGSRSSMLVILDEDAGEAGMGSIDSDISQLPEDSEEDGLPPLNPQ